jgi:stage V sporulation protein SpoVS
MDAIDILNKPAGNHGACGHYATVFMQAAPNQAVKALVLATGYLKNDGINVVCVPEFVDVDIEGNIRTAVKLVVEPR